MARRLKNLTIDEVSSVDRGAGENVRIVLMKRDAADLPPTIKRDEDVIDFTALRKLRQTQEREMDEKALKKLIDDAVSIAVDPLKKSLDDQVKKADALAVENIVLKMSAEHKAMYEKMSDEDKAKFRGMSEEDRQKMCDANKRASEVDPIVKAVMGENADLKKRLEKLETDEMLRVCKADAAAMGMTGDDAAETLMKARRGDLAAIAKVEDHTRTLIKQRDEAIKAGGVFKEFGSRGQSNGSAYDELMLKADELRKGDPKLTREQAFDKAYTDPANASIIERHRAEELKKRQAAA